MKKIFLTLAFLSGCFQQVFAIDFNDYSDLEVKKLVEMLKVDKDENPGVDLYNMATHRTPLKMVTMPRKMNQQDIKKLELLTGWISGDRRFFEQYKYVIELKVPTKEPRLKDFGLFRIYFQESQYPYFIKEINPNDTIMLFYRLSAIDTANQEIFLFCMDFWRPKK